MKRKEKISTVFYYKQFSSNSRFESWRASVLAIRAAGAVFNN
jgi:hypothetical protein